jgi:hypothetical protein
LLAQMIIENAAQFYGFIIKPAKGVWYGESGMLDQGYASLRLFRGSTAPLRMRISD